MCRIFGYLGQIADAEWLTDAGLYQWHGGPDGMYQMAGNGWGVGAARLSITDPVGGAQPYSLLDHGDRIRVVFNGEIYNHDSLRASLGRAGYRFSDRCDGSIIPALYHRYGTAFTEHLDGMYAIAILDLRRVPVLVLATDETGMKPLYYRLDPARGLCFSSEIPALLAVPGAGREVWPEGLDAYLTTKAPFGEQTMFSGIRVLPPASTSVYSAGTGLRVHRRTPEDRPGHHWEDLATAGLAARDVLRRETHRLMSADRPVAAICSGGLDSSLVTTLLAERVPGLEAFHIRYRGRWPMDEGLFADQVAARSGVRLNHVSLSPRQLPDILPKVVAHLGQPNADPITVSTFALFRAVHDAGYKVAVTGDGADEFFGGYDRFRAAVGAGPGWMTRYLDSLAVCPRPMRLGLYSDGYREHLGRVGDATADLTARLRDGSPSALGHDQPATRLDRIIALEVGSRLPAYHLRRVDHLSMASAVEVRLPFCQPAVTALATSLPPGLRVTPSRGKPVLYAAAEGLLPEAVLTRPKQPFTLPLTAMMRGDGPLLRYVKDVLTDGDASAGGQLDPRGVRALLQRHAQAPTNTTALTLWALTVFQLWYRHFVPRPALAAGLADRRAA